MQYSQKILKYARFKVTSINYNFSFSVIHLLSDAFEFILLILLIFILSRYQLPSFANINNLGKTPLKIISTSFKRKSLKVTSKNRFNVFIFEPMIKN